jgi:hypothetical protein
MKRRRSLYARPEIIRGQQCAEAPLDRRRSDPAAAWQYSRQSRAGRYLTVEPSWLPSAACVAHSNTGHRPSGVVVQDIWMPTVPWSPCPRPHVQRPPVQCPASGTCPASARLVSARPVSSARCPCPVRASGIRVHLSAPASSWSAWVRQAATRFGTGRSVTT